MWVLDKERDRQPGDHWSLARAECEVFCIDPELADDLMAAYIRFEAAIDLISLDEAQQRQAEADRLAYPQALEFMGKDGEPTLCDMWCAADFMVKVCGLPHDQAIGWAMSREARNLRDGITDFGDNPISESYRRLREMRFPLLQSAVMVLRDTEGDENEPPF